MAGDKLRRFKMYIIEDVFVPHYFQVCRKILVRIPELNYHWQKLKWVQEVCRVTYGFLFAAQLFARIAYTICFSVHVPDLVIEYRVVRSERACLHSAVQIVNIAELSRQMAAIL